MKSTLALFTAALMTTALAGAPAFAQSGSDSSSGSGGGMKSDSMSTQDMGSKSTNTDQMKSQTDASGAMGASESMMPIAEVTSKLQTMTEVSSVEVVKVSDMANTDHSTGDAMPPVDTTPEEQAALQTAIQGNAAINDKLEAQSVNASQVVAANVDANNTVTVYVE